MDNNFYQSLREAIVEYAMDTEDPFKNYVLAILYESIGQTASAVTFFLRASERTENDNLAYECLLRMSFCFDAQGNRNNTVRSVLRSAITLLPKRPEAYYLLAKAYEKTGSFVDCYLFSKLALDFCDFNQPNLNTYVKYPGKYGLIYQKALGAWWWGKSQESRDLFVLLKKEYIDQLDEAHRLGLEENIRKLNCSV